MESVTDVGSHAGLTAVLANVDRGEVLAGRYQIETLIGTGGSGKVFRAYDRITRSLVALKILKPEFAADPVWVDRFSRELRLGRQLVHPNVCRVFDIGEADGHRFLTMELATGGSIRSQLGKVRSKAGPTGETAGEPRSLAERLDDARAIVEGLAAIHGIGIVHRDIKPDNILRMEDGRLIITDFGLATDAGNQGNTIMVGTPAYMAPEVVMGDPATLRSDVWGLGVVLPRGRLWRAARVGDGGARAAALHPADHDDSDRASAGGALRAVRG